MGRAIGIGTVVVLLLHPILANAQQASIDAFYVDPESFAELTHVSPAVQALRRVATTNERPNSRHMHMKDSRRFAPSTPTSAIVPATLRQALAAIAGGVRALTSRFVTAALANRGRVASRAVPRSVADSDTVDVGCLVNAYSSGDDISVNGRLAVHGGGWSTYFDWSGGGSETFGQAFIFSIPRSTDTYSVHCHGDFMFSSISQIIPVDAYGQVPQTLFMPTGEFNQFNGWNGIEDTIAVWKVTLEPEFMSFGGRWIREANGPGGATENCWWPGSQLDEIGPIPLQNPQQLPSGQSFWFDAVGYPPSRVSYYRSQNRAPCWFDSDQEMRINTRGGQAEPMATYHHVQLQGGMTYTTVWSRRGPNEQERIWP